MEEAYKNSLKIIKELRIEEEKEYNKLLHKYFLLNVESLKYISQTRKFKKIVEIAKEA